MAAPEAEDVKKMDVATSAERRARRFFILQNPISYISAILNDLKISA